MKIDGVELQKLAEQVGHNPGDYTPLERRLMADLVDLWFKFSALKSRVTIHTDNMKDALRSSEVVFEEKEWNP